MHHSNQITQRILSVVAAQNGLPLTPSFVAYEIDTTTAEAEEMLDEMVRQSVLEYDFDATGEISYRPGAAYPYDEIGRPARRGENLTGWDATDAGIGRADAGQGRAKLRTSGYDGLDGDVVTAAPSSRGYASRPRATRRGRGAQPPRRRGASRRPDSGRPSAHMTSAGYTSAIIGPNGCDGSIGQPGEAPSQFFTAPEPDHRSFSQKHRRFREQMTQPGTQLIPTEPDQLPARKMSKAEPLLAAVFSLFFAGSGQLYNGQIAKGIAFFISFLLLWSFALGWIVQIWAAVDAYQTAANMRELAAD